MAFKDRVGNLFRRRSTAIPEHHRPEGSINAELHELPVRREHAYLTYQRVLLLPRLGFVVYAHRLSSGGMDCAIIVGNGRYPRGGYDIFVSDWELVRAVILDDDALLAAARAGAAVPFKAIVEASDPPQPASCPSLRLYRGELQSCVAEGRHGEHCAEDGLTWPTELAVSDPWPINYEPGQGIDTLMDLGAWSGLRRLVRVREHGWHWEGDPGTSPGAIGSWEVCASRTFGDLRVVKS